MLAFLLLWFAVFCILAALLLTSVVWWNLFLHCVDHYPDWVTFGYLCATLSLLVASVMAIVKHEPINPQTPQHVEAPAER
jgi:hypothetical protein